MAFEEKDGSAELAGEDREMLEYYLAGASERLSQLSSAVSAAKQGGAGSKDGLRNALHKLAGSAGTYGFPELGETARAMEKRVIAADEPIAEDILLDAIALRHDLEQAFEEARSKLAPPAKVPPLSTVRQKLVVAVIGGGLEDPRTDDTARAVGKALARAGAHLVCGGLGGCMEGAARGFREAQGDGLVVGILPGASRHEANCWIDLRIPTGVRQAQAEPAWHQPRHRPGRAVRALHPSTKGESFSIG